MKILVVTEKYSPEESQRDGGARLIETLRSEFGDCLTIMQFGPHQGASSTWCYDYPFSSTSRFERRIANASFIAEKVQAVAHLFSHIIFVHLSMQFGFNNPSLHEIVQVWTFPMFLSPSYSASGEFVPNKYIEMERATLAFSKNIVTPSYLEKQQLMEHYAISDECIHVIPRGIDATTFLPKSRTLKGAPRFCSIGSIKPQKNTLELVRLFDKIRNKYPSSHLKIIGPVQNTNYYEQVRLAISRLKLDEAIEFTGYVSPEKLSLITEDSHLHLSTSLCETFGRSIFETLAAGLPNIAKATGNAASDFLQHLPYVRFLDKENEIVEAVEELLDHLSVLSPLAVEIGTLYDDKFLAKLLSAKIGNRNCIAICDFDGTLFHKHDPEKTQRCINAFRTYQKRIVCSARPIQDLLAQLASFDLEVDWVIGYSGSVVSNGLGTSLWHVPLEAHQVARLKSLPENTLIEYEERVLQVAIPKKLAYNELGLRVETYQNTAFIAHWKASKFRAVHRLLQHINWSGQVRVFGDGPYDKELLNYYDGVLVSQNPQEHNRQKREVVNV